MSRSFADRFMTAFQKRGGYGLFHPQRTGKAVYAKNARLVCNVRSLAETGNDLRLLAFPLRLRLPQRERVLVSRFLRFAVV
jgi:hypothetical protein